MDVLSKNQILTTAKKFISENPLGVIEILGSTASGKTGFSIEVAKIFPKAEIISADSRQVFEDIDISSAKITSAEMQGIPHHGLNLVKPTETYSVVDFQKYAFEKIREIQARGAVPILCGGTMLWLDAVSENYIFSDEKGQKSNERSEPLWDFLKIGIHWDRKKLYERINERAKQHFENGLVEETKTIGQKYPISKSAATSFGYREISEYLRHEISLTRALELNQQRNRNYAKRQLTWWRNRTDILWVDGENL